jgi:hypothetical protein
MLAKDQIPMDVDCRRARERVLNSKYKTIREYAIALMMLVHHRRDGRAYGYDYGNIRECILKKFPTVKNTGPHHGRPTKMSFKDLIEIGCELNRDGVKLPFRPRRRKAPNAKKKLST